MAMRKKGCFVSKEVVQRRWIHRLQNKSVETLISIVDAAKKQRDARLLKDESIGFSQWIADALKKRNERRKSCPKKQEIHDAGGWTTQIEFMRTQKPKK